MVRCRILIHAKISEHLRDSITDSSLALYDQLHKFWVEQLTILFNIHHNMQFTNGNIKANFFPQVYSMKGRNKPSLVMMKFSHKYHSPSKCAWELLVYSQHSDFPGFLKLRYRRRACMALITGDQRGLCVASRETLLQKNHSSPPCRRNCYRTPLHSQLQIKLGSESSP